MMKIRNQARRCAALLLALSLLLFLAACGGKETSKATSMHLKRTEGMVSVSDDGGKDVTLLDNLGLYSGYGVKTRAESYAWINLDDVKLTKMDQGSEIAIQKAGKALEIKVRSGSLFFNVTEPLKRDETMNIRTSTMLVGIRGTCGWVEDNDGLSRVYLLEGKVECSAGEQTVTVSAGEMAELTVDGELTVSEFTTQDLPAFVWDELDDELAQAVPEDPGTPGVEEYEFQTQVTPDGLNVDAENLTVRVRNNRSAVITVSGISMKDSYLTNLPTSQMNTGEYHWNVSMFGDREAYMVSTISMADNPGAEITKSPAEMEHRVYIMEGINAWFRIGEAEMSYTADSITWTFTLPEGYSFDFANVNRYEVQVVDVPQDLAILRFYTLN